MRYAKAAALVMTVFMVVTCLPAAISDDSDAAASTYVSTDKIKLTGFAYYDSDITSDIPVIYVFVVHHTSDKYEFSDVSNGKMMTAAVYVNPANKDDPKNYSFSVEVPLINSPDAEYYICAFNSFKISSVSSSMDPTAKTIVADDTWKDAPMSGFAAWEVKRSVWSTTAPDHEAQITGSAGSYDRITLIGARGTVTGHVNGLISGETNDLSDVTVEFYNDNGDRINSATTNSHGDFSIKLPTGFYTVKFVRGSYSCEPVKIVVNEGTCSMQDVTMTIRMDTQFFGYDLTHFLAIIGGVVCTMIVTIAIMYQYRRYRKGPNRREWILDDMPVAEDEEKKE